MGAQEKNEKEENKEKDLDRMTVKELRTLAAESTDLVGTHEMKKAELLAAIKEAKGIKEEKAPKEKVEKGAITVQELKRKVMGAEEKKEKDLDRMTVTELRALAAESTDLVGTHEMKKAELLAAIKEAKGIKEEKAPKEKVEKGAITAKQLKAKIVELKEKREEARKAKDKRMVDILRRRISRAKKRTRKISQA